MVLLKLLWSFLPESSDFTFYSDADLTITWSCVFAEICRKVSSSWSLSWYSSCNRRFSPALQLRDSCYSVRRRMFSLAAAAVCCNNAEGDDWLAPSYRSQDFENIPRSEVMLFRLFGNGSMMELITAAPTNAMCGEFSKVSDKHFGDNSQLCHQ